MYEALSTSSSTAVKLAAIKILTDSLDRLTPTDETSRDLLLCDHLQAATQRFHYFACEDKPNVAKPMQDYIIKLVEIAATSQNEAVISEGLDLVSAFGRIAERQYKDTPSGKLGIPNKRANMMRDNLCRADPRLLAAVY